MTDATPQMMSLMHNRNCLLSAFVCFLWGGFHIFIHWISDT